MNLSAKTELRKISSFLVPITNCVHPIVFETNMEESRYGSLGTCTLLSLPCGLFAMTVEHVVKDSDVKNIIIIPRRPKMKTVRFSKTFPFSCTHSDQLEKIVLLEVDPSSLNGDNTPDAIDIFSMPNDWEENPEDYKYMVFGYPNETRRLNYETKELEFPQYCFSAVYSGSSSIDNCSKLSICNIIGPKNIDGYSGSPVFAWKKGEADVESINFCGLAVRGSFSSKAMHFLERNFIAEIASQICASFESS